MEKILSKFGGSSLASAKKIRQVAEIIRQDARRKILVVSAPGKAEASQEKITDLFIALAKAIYNDFPKEEILEEILSRFAKIISELGMSSTMTNEIKKDIEERIQNNASNYEDLENALKAAGEDNHAKIIAKYFNSIGLEASYVSPLEAGFYLDNSSGAVQLLSESLENVREHLAYRNEILVFPGFFGYSKEGKVITFTRGGSDITGSLVSAALGVSLYENFTDVDCVYAVKPKLVADPHPIPEMTYDEMRELAYTGFQVIHEDAIEPLRRHNIPLHIKNTSNPNGMGTKVLSKRSDFDGILTGISGKKGFCILHVEKYLMNQEVGFAMKVLQIIAEEGLSFEHMPSGIDSLSIIFKEENLTPHKERRVVTRILQELEVDTCYVSRGLALIMTVGVAMKNTVGVLARTVEVLSRAGINIKIVVQSPAEISILFAIEETLCNYAIRALYKEFF